MLVKKFGVKAIIQVAQGNQPDQDAYVPMSAQDIDNINTYYKTLLEGDPREATIEELLECTQIENAVERIAFRKEVASGGRRNFVRLGKDEKGQT